MLRSLWWRVCLLVVCGTVESPSSVGVLLKVLGQAGPSVMIFTIVAMVPCVGLSLSYHVTFGATLKSYSSPWMALNSVMRMAVGGAYYCSDLACASSPDLHSCILDVVDVSGMSLVSWCGNPLHEFLQTSISGRSMASILRCLCCYFGSPLF